MISFILKQLGPPPGYVISSTDGDDNNANINRNQLEPVYNGIDDGCNSTLDDNLDQDGFLLADDCNDENDSINPDVAEIPNNILIGGTSTTMMAFRVLTLRAATLMFGLPGLFNYLPS